MEDSFYWQLKKITLQEGNTAIDVTHLGSARSCNGIRKERKPAPKKSGRKVKAEREQWLKDKQAEEEARPIYEKEFVHRLSEFALS